MARPKPDKNRALRVALTGATGFSGSFILPQLIAAGFEVRALARNPSALAGKCSDVVVGGLDDAVALAKLVDGVDVVLHVAGAISAKSRQEFFDVNFEGTMRLFLVARAAHVTRFVFVSSLAAREPDISDYAASKAAAEKFLLPFDDEDCDVLILRPPAIYGPGDKATLPLFKALQSRTAILPGTKASRFSMLYVADFAKVACEAVDNKAHAVFELDDQSLGYRWADLVAASQAIHGNPKRVIYLPRGVAHFIAGVAETVGQFRSVPPFTTRQTMAQMYHHDWVTNGWIWPVAKPVKMPEGLAQTFQWYQQQGWLPSRKQPTRSAS